MSSHNAAVSSRSNALDQFLRLGGIVLASSERAARSLRGTYNQRRLSDGQTAWPAPLILEWSAFLRQQWTLLAQNGKMLLSPLQEEWLWASIAANSGQDATALHGPRYRLANMARKAHSLLASYAPELLEASNRVAWKTDAGVFSQWLTEFQAQCHEQNLSSESWMVRDLTAILSLDAGVRPPLLLAGFDRLLPTQLSLLNAWGKWELMEDGPTTSDIAYYSMPDAAAELDACANWCREQLDINPDARLLVLAQDAAARRGEIERAFVHRATPEIEFSLGVPLSSVPLVRGALLILRWLTKPLDEHEVDYLFGSGISALNAQETASLERLMRKIRSRQLERPEWTLEALVNAAPGEFRAPEEWAERMITASRLLKEAKYRQKPLEWAKLVPQLLKAVGWPGTHPLPSASFQALEHWQRAVDACGTLGFNGVEIGWPVFHSALARSIEDTLFSPESENPAILISGPLQSAGLVADGIWFLGAEENTWPITGSTHPFLPIGVQREYMMPHAMAESDTELAEATTRRLLASAPVVRFSMARQRGKAEANSSRMIENIAGKPKRLDTVRIQAQPLTESFVDDVLVPLPGTVASGGSATISHQSQCPFRAFAVSRLSADGWQRAEPGLNQRVRGQLVHDVLAAVWGGPATSGWRTSAELHSLLDTSGRAGLKQFVSQHVESVFKSEFIANLCARLPATYLVLEQQRLVRLVTEWLLYEDTRSPFTVTKTEEKSEVTIEGLTFRLRLDRQDELQDGGTLVIDYKTGTAGPERWQLPRPEDLQLPLYAGFAVEQASGLAFATVRTCEHEFKGRVRNADLLLPGLNGNSSIVKHPLNDEMLANWRGVIEQLVRDFIAGKADVNPLDHPTTCEQCGLHSVCRIEDIRSLS
jgi:probable DNA repair protein